MLDAMVSAPLGDDVFGEDPTINLLEARMADMFSIEAGLYCASGTMANQIAIRSLTSPMDEIIAHELCHIYYYETGGYAANSGVSIKLARGEGGIISPDDITANIQPNLDWLPRTSLVTIENTCNKGGGTCYSLDQMKAISEISRANKLKLHLDGARIFNAILAKNFSVSETGPLFDTVSVCFSKGLGAPVGSVLLGSKETIRKARRIRKVFGGGMRQAGILAAACLYALDNNMEKLNQDHKHAAYLADVFSSMTWVKKVIQPETNILLFDVADDLDVEKVIEILKANGILTIRFGPSRIRCVLHLDISAAHVDYVEEKCRRLDF